MYTCSKCSIAVILIKDEKGNIVDIIKPCACNASIIADIQSNLFGNSGILF